MADISMCQDDICPSRKTCERHADSGTPVSEFWQAYAAFVRMPGDDTCGDYLKVNRPGVEK